MENGNSEGKRIRVGVIFGGRSGEHEVSLNSAQSVMNALNPAKYDVLPIGIDKNGRWLTGNVVGIAQQWYINQTEMKHMIEEKRAAAARKKQAAKK